MEGDATDRRYQLCFRKKTNLKNLAIPFCPEAKKSELSNNTRIYLHYMINFLKNDG